MSQRLGYDDYTIGWISALPIELAAATVMLDQEHQNLPQPRGDNNIYTLGNIGCHNVVLASLPAGQMGTSSAAAVAVQMASTFKSLRFGLMVGIGGAVPSEHDIRLGDVVISQPAGIHGGVVQYDFGKTEAGGFRRTGFLNAPPQVLLQALSKFQSNQIVGRSSLPVHLGAYDKLPKFSRRSCGPDILFEASYNHPGGPTCNNCDKGMVVSREPRKISSPPELCIHYGNIASGNQVMKNAQTRDKLSSELGGIMCFEMEAAGLMNSFPCLVIRGICDYADSHKNKTWQPYAASVAAACAKELISILPANSVAAAPRVIN